MKKYLSILLPVLILVFGSCGAEKETVDAMAEEMCSLMEEYDPDDFNSIIEVAGKMMELEAKDSYSGVSDKQLNIAMEEKCPEGFIKYKDM